MEGKDLNRLKVVLAEKKRTNKWLAEQLGKAPATVSKWDNVTYVEPFVGGGAMLFYMLQRYPNIRHVVINDVNPDLITCYRTVRDMPEELIASLTDIQNAYNEHCM